jgi:hypothetical protein
MTIRDHPQVKEFKDAAERYCALLQFDPDEPERWVEEILAALSSLYAKGHGLPDLGLTNEAPDIPDSLDVTADEWRSVFGRVHKVLGKQEAYWAYFDPSEPADADEEPIFHSLADDLADVYRDVMPGLRAWSALDDRYLETIVFDWKTPNFGSHWGLHAVSAMRALHPIAFLRGLATNAEPSAPANSDSAPG